MKKLNEIVIVSLEFSSSAIFGHFPAAKTKFEVRLTKIKWNSVWSIFGLKATTQIVKTERQQRWRQTRDSLFKGKHINKKVPPDWFYLFSFVLPSHSLKSFSEEGERTDEELQKSLGPSLRVPAWKSNWFIGEIKTSRVLSFFL